MEIRGRREAGRERDKIRYRQSGTSYFPLPALIA